MLRMPGFEVVAPEDVDTALEALSCEGARLLAGGTDLLPALKHRLAAPVRLVTLHRIEALRRIVVDEPNREMRIGTSVVLARLAGDERVRASFPSLAEAARSVASPQIRRTATLGGNIHVDTRCRYVDQSEPWRGAIGGCLKSGGLVCHVVEGGRRCVAAISSDTVPVLVSLDASIVVVGKRRERVIPLGRYFKADGVYHLDRAPDELATEVRIPLAGGPRRTAYVKWRPRGSIDFPLVSVAIRLDLDADDAAARVIAARVVAGSLNAKPREVALPKGVNGRRIDDPELARAISEATWEQCKPLANLPYDPEHRRHLYRVLTRRAVLAMGGRQP